MAIDLNGHTIVTEGKKIDLLLTKISGEGGFIHIIREGLIFPNVSFWESYNQWENEPVIRGSYPIVEVTPPLVGGEVTFSPVATVAGHQGRYTIAPSSIIIRDVATGIDRTITPDSRGAFRFTFTGARAHHLFLRFDGVVDPEVRIFDFRG